MGHRVVMDHPGTDLLKGSNVFPSREAGRQAVSQLGHGILINRRKGWSVKTTAGQSVTGTINIL